MSHRKNKKNIMLVCGSGIVSSTLVAPMVEEILQEGKLRYELIKGRIHDIASRIEDLDLILTTVPLPKEVSESKVPVVVVTDLMGGRKEEVARRIMEALGGRETL